jgi:hypothetical protein
VCPGVRPWVVQELDLAHGASCSNKYLTGHRLCCPTRPEAHSNLNNDPTYNERTMPNSARTFTSVVIGSQPSTLSLEIFPALCSPTRQATSSRSLIASRTSSIFVHRETVSKMLGHNLESPGIHVQTGQVWRRIPTVSSAHDSSHQSPTN